MTVVRCGFVLLSIGLLCRSSQAEPACPSAATVRTIEWRSDYRAALDEAEAARGMVFLWFTDPAESKEREAVTRELLDSCLQSQSATFLVPLRLPIDSPMPCDQPSSMQLLDHAAFVELGGRAGIAVIDMRDDCSPNYHHVVSIYPFAHGPLAAEQLTAMLELPPGSLTQRTLIWAVRTHGDLPASTSGESSPLLMREAADHSRRQAALDRQGHHEWEARFHAINERLPPHLVAQEVCAESWPGQDLIAAARECVASWRKSGGHWDAVSAPHPQFGYDMCRSASGIWYATGIFGRKK